MKVGVSREARGSGLLTSEYSAANNSTCGACPGTARGGYGIVVSEVAA